jgi:hypothetical protein
MASSVSSERAFSLAGITLCKQHNRLDGDIIEALQCLKSLIHQDLLAWDIIMIADEELELVHADEQPANQDITSIEVVDAGDELGWGTVSDKGNHIAEAGDNDTDIELV